MELFLKDKFTQKWNFSCYPLSLMQMKSRVKIRSPQNISGVSRQNSVAAFSQTTEVDWDLFEKHKNTTKHKFEMAHITSDAVWMTLI